MKLFKYLLTANDAVKKVLKAEIQERLIKRTLEGKIDSFETKGMTLEADLTAAYGELAVAKAEEVNAKLQKILDIKLEIEAAEKAQELLTEVQEVLFEDEFTPPPEAEAAKHVKDK